MDWSSKCVLEFVELLQGEPWIWNPKNNKHRNRTLVNDAWVRIKNKFSVPCSVEELKKKKNCLLTQYRENLKKIKESTQTGAGYEEIYKPSWFAFDAIHSYMGPVYGYRPTLSTVVRTQPDLNEEASLSNEQASDTFTEGKNDDHENAEILIEKTFTQRQKRRAEDPPEFQETSIRMSPAFTVMNNAITKQSDKEDDECDLFCKMLAKQIREYPKHEREEIMYELHGVMMKKRRRYNAMNCRTYSQVELNRPSTSNGHYLRTPSPEYKFDPS